MDGEARRKFTVRNGKWEGGGIGSRWAVAAQAEACASKTNLGWSTGKKKQERKTGKKRQERKDKKENGGLPLEENSVSRASGCGWSR
jgi:hypothetical protein